MENIRKHRDIKLVTTDKRRNQLASEPNCHPTKLFSENLIAMEIKKIKVKMNKRIYLGMSILVISKALMYEFGMITLNQNIKTKQNYFTRILTALSFILKPTIFMKTFLIMSKNGLIHQTTAKIIDCFR